MKRKAKLIASFGSYEERLTIWVRWAVLFLAVLLVALEPEAVGNRGVGLYCTIIGATAYNILLFFFSARLLAFMRRGWISLGFDLLFATLLVVFTAGSKSQFFYLYVLAIFWAALTGGKQTALKVTLVAIGLYVLALLARQEFSGGNLFLYDLCFKTGLLSLTAFWSGLIADQRMQWTCRTQELSRIADEWTRAASYNQTAAMFGIGAMMSSSTSIEETLNLTLDAVADIIHSDRCSILLLDHRTNELVLRAARGVRAGAVGKLRLRSDQGVAGEVLRTGLPLNIPDTDNEPLFVPSPQGYDKIRSMLVVPLVVKEKRIGVINISEINEQRQFTAEELNAIKLVATYTAVALQNAGILEEKEREAITDGLTGLYNYRYFLDRLEKAIAAVGENGRSLALIWMDLDYFKEYNDNFGHLKGSEILKRLGSITAVTSSP
jgi:GAF domain-containing protein